jgi:CheY-like chemotaxis protein
MQGATQSWTHCESHRAANRRDTEPEREIETERDLTYPGLAIAVCEHEHAFVELPIRATVVVVEGTAAVQELIDLALREAGHRVLVTRNPLEVIELARRVRIDVLIADAETLEREGPNLVEKLGSIQPAMAVLYMAARGQADEDAENASALRAPFSLDELQEAVTAAVDRAAEPR